jgi:fluoride exporter
VTSTRTQDRHRALPPATKVLGVAAGGALGGSLRALFIEVFPAGPGSFPWVVFVENVTGAFALGFLLSVLMARWHRAWDLRPFLCTGVLGSFTTFSNLSLGIVELGRAGAWLLSLAYAFGSLLAGIAAAVLGILAARAVVGGPSS